MKCKKEKMIDFLLNNANPSIKRRVKGEVEGNGSGRLEACFRSLDRSLFLEDDMKNMPPGHAVAHRLQANNLAAQSCAGNDDYCRRTAGTGGGTGSGFQTLFLQNVSGSFTVEESMN